MHACILLLICMHVNSVASKILGFGRSWELQAAAGWRDRQGEREREREVLLGTIILNRGVPVS